MVWRGFIQSCPPVMNPCLLKNRHPLDRIFHHSPQPVPVHRGSEAVGLVLVTRPKHEAGPFRSKVEGVRHFNRHGSIVWDCIEGIGDKTHPAQWLDGNLDAYQTTKLTAPYSSTEDDDPWREAPPIGLNRHYPRSLALNRRDFGHFNEGRTKTPCLGRERLHHFMRTAVAIGRTVGGSHDIIHREPRPAGCYLFWRKHLNRQSQALLESGTAFKGRECFLRREQKKIANLMKIDPFCIRRKF